MSWQQHIWPQGNAPNASPGMHAGLSNNTRVSTSMMHPQPQFSLQYSVDFHQGMPAQTHYVSATDSSSLGMYRRNASEYERQDSGMQGFLKSSDLPIDYTWQQPVTSGSVQSYYPIENRTPHAAAKNKASGEIPVLSQGNGYRKCKDRGTKVSADKRDEHACRYIEKSRTLKDVVGNHGEHLPTNMPIQPNQESRDDMQVDHQYAILFDALKQNEKATAWPLQFACCLCSLKGLMFQDMVGHVESAAHMRKLYVWLNNPGSSHNANYKESLRKQVQIRALSHHTHLLVCELCMKPLGSSTPSWSSHIKGTVHIKKRQSIVERYGWTARGQVIKHEKKMAELQEASQSVLAPAAPVDRTKLQEILKAIKSSGSQNNYMGVSQESTSLADGAGQNWPRDEDFRDIRFRSLMGGSIQQPNESCLARQSPKLPGQMASQKLDNGNNEYQSRSSLWDQDHCNWSGNVNTPQDSAHAFGESRAMQDSFQVTQSYRSTRVHSELVDSEMRNAASKYYKDAHHNEEARFHEQLGETKRFISDNAAHMHQQMNTGHILEMLQKDAITKNLSGLHNEGNTESDPKVVSVVSHHDQKQMSHAPPIMAKELSAQEKQSRYSNFGQNRSESYSSYGRDPLSASPTTAVLVHKRRSSQSPNRTSYRYSQGHMDKSPSSNRRSSRQSDSSRGKSRSPVQQTPRKCPKSENFRSLRKRHGGSQSPVKERSPSVKRRRVSPTKRQARSPIHVIAERKKRRRLSPRDLSPHGRQVLTSKIESTWQAYYHKYYTCIKSNPEIVYELQKAYLQSYKGFFKEDPCFENYYVTPARPEDLREALTLRIERGSPGPADEDAAEQQRTRRKVDEEHNAARQHASMVPDYANQGLVKPLQSATVLAKKEMSCLSENTISHRDDQLMMECEDLKTQPVRKDEESTHEKKCVVSSENAANDITIKHSKIVGAYTVAPSDRKSILLAVNGSSFKGKQFTETIENSDCGLSEMSNAHQLCAEKSHTANRTSGIKRIAWPEPDTTTPTELIPVKEEKQVAQNSKLIRSQIDTKEMPAIDKSIKLSTLQGKPQTVKNVKLSIAKHQPEKARPVPNMEQNATETYDDTAHHPTFAEGEAFHQTVEHDNSMPAYSSDVVLEIRRATSVMNRLGSQHRDPEEIKGRLGLQPFEPREKSIRNEVVERTVSSSNLKNRLGPQRYSHEECEEPIAGVHESNLEPPNFTEIFRDPFLAFVHKTLTGIIVISQLQQAMVNKPSGNLKEMQQRVLFERNEMKQRMITEEGHMLIRMARCAIRQPDDIEVEFPSVSPDVAPILRNLDADVVRLIAETPIV